MKTSRMRSVCVSGAGQLVHYSGCGLGCAWAVELQRSRAGVNCKRLQAACCGVLLLGSG